MDRTETLSRKPWRTAALILALGLVSACEDGSVPGFLQPKDEPVETGSQPGQSTKLVERDIEAPDVFQVTEAGLWDGRPSLGGVWVAHPEVKDPQRVIIRNSANGKFVIGALFRRERDIPGPRIQASSDAAAALGMLAGAPSKLNVTALIREPVPEEPVEPVAVEVEKAETDTVVADTSGTINETALDPIADAAAAIEAAAPTIKPTQKPGAKPSSLGKPYIQIGIFSVESNAEQTANQMRSAGMVPTVFDQKSNGKRFWRVVVGPSQNSSERSTLLKKVKSAGFSDAYFVTN
ncbi:MAG: SPOR domain-containing protein [Rhodobacteraceae bacterium]|nr:SPOR domain-containing protein [Paracoccaceae bacterium]